ncbi:MAG TPA: fused MFS/spermidine synthase, partial [Acidimicrobiia bacterium]
MTQRLARILVFATSASVLVIEILAVRLLAPYLGVSLEVFTGVIGVILAGIAFGAWLGGRAADRIDPKRLLGPLLVAGGLTALVSPLIVDLVGPSASTGAFS